MGLNDHSERVDTEQRRLQFGVCPSNEDYPMPSSELHHHPTGRHKCSSSNDSGQNIAFGFTFHANYHHSPFSSLFPCSTRTVYFLQSSLLLVLCLYYQAHKNAVIAYFSAGRYCRRRHCYHSQHQCLQQLHVINQHKTQAFRGRFYGCLAST